MLKRSLLISLLVPALLCAAATVGPATASAATCDAPTITGVPATGHLRVGAALTAHAGGNCELLTLSETIKWQQCDTSGGTGCVDVTTATPASTQDYAVLTPDRTKFLRVRQTVTSVGPTVNQDTATTSKVFGTGPPTVGTIVPTNDMPHRGAPVNFGVAPTANDPDGDTITYEWHFGDGLTAAVANPSHTYSTSGTKTVTLIVRDSDGETGAATPKVVHVKAPPVSSFVFSPSAPISGKLVVFRATSKDVDGDAITNSWDLDGNGTYETAGNTVSRTYTAVGNHTVKLKASADGESSTSFKTVVVKKAPTTTTPPSTGGGTDRLVKLSPFPRVTIAGRFTRRGVRLTRLVVRGPRGAHVRIVCRGHGCKRRTTRGKIGRSKKLRVRSFERTFRSGATVTVFVRKGHKIGKYSKFRIRRNRTPARRDRCLKPGAAKPVRCSSL